MGVEKTMAKGIMKRGWSQYTSKGGHKIDTLKNYVPRRQFKILYTT